MQLLLWSLVCVMWSAVCQALPSCHHVARRGLPDIPGGIPLDLLFAACSATGGQQTAGSSPPDIGPCLSQVLGGIIEAARPSFSSGIKVGRKRRVLEPLRLKDIPEKEEKQFKLAASNFLLHGLSTIQVKGIVFQPDLVSLSLHFERLEATARLKLKYVFLSAEPDVRLSLHGLRLNVTANWKVENNAVNHQLDLVLSDARVGIRVDSVSARIERLAGLGGFIENVLNSNNQILIRFLIPPLEEDATEKFNEEFNRIKIAS